MATHWPAAPAMAAAIDTDVFSSLIGALETGSNLDIIKDLLAGMRQETEEEYEEARWVLVAAMREDERVFQVVLDVMCKEVIVPSDQEMRPALASALDGGEVVDYDSDGNGDGRKEIVMAVVERMAKETPYELNTEPLCALFQSHLFGDQEVVNAVLSVVPPATFAKPEDLHDRDVLDLALSCPCLHVQRAVDLVMRFVPSMAERLEGQRRFRYVRTAAEFGYFSEVRTMHDSIPLLADGSGRRGSDRDYAYAINGLIEGVICREIHPTHVLKFLVNEGGTGCLDMCESRLVFDVPTEEDVEWLLARAPLMLERACCRSDIRELLFPETETFEYAYFVNLIVERVEAEVIVEMVKQTLPDDWFLADDETGKKGVGRYCLRKLHEKDPECVPDDFRWRWLVESILDKAYEDVEYVAGTCNRGHLTRRSGLNTTAFEMAAEDSEFPKELLDRLRVTTTKGAHA